MTERTLADYFRAMEAIPGWCSPDDVLTVMAYNQLLAQRRIQGDVLEIKDKGSETSMVELSVR